MFCAQNIISQSQQHINPRNTTKQAATCATQEVRNSNT
jgi:hypothetical protein